MDTNSEKSFRELIEEAEPYNLKDPEMNQFDGEDFFRMLKTIKKELDEGLYKD